MAELEDDLAARIFDELEALPAFLTPLALEAGVTIESEYLEPAELVQVGLAMSIPGHQRAVHGVQLHRLGRWSR